MSSLCESAYNDGLYDNVRSFDDIRKTMHSRDSGLELIESRWWANERPKLRVYLVAVCWDKKPGELFLSKDARSQMASRDWMSIPATLRASIKNEMSRLQLSYKVMRGQ